MNRVRLAAIVAVATLVVPAVARARTVHATLPRPRHGIQVRVSPFPVPARAEREVCQAIALPLRRALDVAAMEFVSPVGRDYVSHHFALFVDDIDTIDRLPEGPIEAPGCAGVGSAFGAIVAGVQAPRARVRLPAGVGFTFQPHQIVLLNLHYINASDEPLMVDGVVNLLRSRKRVRHHAYGFQLGTIAIDVPPGEDGSAQAQWRARFPMNVVMLSTHSHKHTTAVDVDLLRGGSDAGQLIETVDYRHPAVDLLPTSLRLEPGDGFRWTCRYHNETDVPLTFGITSNDEMCFTIGAFYLDDDAAPLPAVPGCFGGHVALTCPFLR